MSIWKRRRDRMAESREALAKQERLAPFIDMQKRDAQELGEWARDRLRRNSLSQLFDNPRGA